MKNNNAPAPFNTKYVPGFAQHAIIEYCRYCEQNPDTSMDDRMLAWRRIFQRVQS
jgi:hypothetical protein